MDLRKFLSKLTQVLNVVKYIYFQKRLCALEIEDQVSIPHTTLYRDLEYWCEEGYLKKIKNF